MWRLVGRSCSIVALVATVMLSCSSPQHRVVAPTVDEPEEPKGVRLTLEADADGSCCLVSTVNPGEEMSVGCFVVVFDASADYVTTVLLPPKPEGHTRSSGFVAPAGTASQGSFEIPLDLVTGSYRSTCRPAAWHGGAPI